MIVTTNEIQIDPPSLAFLFFVDPYNEDHQLTVTRCLAALSVSLSTSQRYYSLPNLLDDSINSDFENSEDTSVDIISDPRPDLFSFSPKMLVDR